MNLLARRSALDDALLVGAPAITVILLVTYLSRHEFAVDFQHAFWVVGHRMILGRSPYSWTHAQIASAVSAFPYPALTALLFAPFGLVPESAAAAIWVAGSMAAVPATLRVLRVRDWRLHAIAFLWWPVIIAWQSANMTLVLSLLVALIWRYRDRPAVAGLLAATLISLKPVLWPIGLWLLATRRIAATGWALATGVLLNLVAWSIVGFDQLGRYIHLDSAVTTALYRYGYGIISMAVRAGASRTLGTVLMVGLSLPLVVLCLWLGSRRRDAQALLIAVVLTLTASPLAWMHYLALLLVPMAVLRPRMSPEWLLPLVLWLCPGGLHESIWQVVVFALITAGATGLLLRRHPGARARRGSEQWRPGPPHVLATPQGGERAG